MRVRAAAPAPPGPEISAGVLAGDLLRLGDAARRLRDAGAGLLHVDVMDGRFAGPLMGGPALVRALARVAALDVHLMVEDPLSHAVDHAEAGAAAVTFHLEATDDPHRVLAALGERGVARGVALSPTTPIGALAPVLENVDLVLVLALDPTTRATPPLEDTVARLHSVRALIAARPVTLSVDGSVTLATAAAFAAAGVDRVVSGSALFAAPGPEAMVPAMRKALATGQAMRGNSGEGPRGTMGQTSTTTSSWSTT